MIDDGKIVQAAEYLARRYQARESLDIMLQDFAPTTIEDAYRVQDAFLSILGQDKGPLGGYKIAYTSDEMRRLRGISSPCAGGMFAATIQDSPATFRSADYDRLAIECEVAVRLGTDVPASRAPYSRARALPIILRFLPWPSRWSISERLPQVQARTPLPLRVSARTYPMPARC